MKLNFPSHFSVQTFKVESLLYRATMIVSSCAILIVSHSCNDKVATNKQVFLYNEQSGIATLDPAFAKNQSIMWAVHQVYNTLVETDASLNIVPSLAKSWDVSDDRLHYIFHLRTDVFFHDHDVFPGGRGRKMNAYDVEYSFRRIVDRNTASSGAWIFNNRVDSVAGFKATNDSTFELKLVRPFTPILGLLSMQYCSIVPKEVVEKYGKDFRNHPCGTGPFQFKSWEEGQALILLKNKNYFETDSVGNKLPYLDAIKTTFYDNKATEFLLFQQGELDFINDIDASFKDEVLTKRGELRGEWKKRIRLYKHPYLNTEYLGILFDSTNDLVKSSPTRFKKVRQAMNYGFDRRKMILYLRNSIGIPAESGFVPAGLPSFDSSVVQGYTYNPSKARQLMREAGFTEGKNIAAIKLLTISVYGDLASFIAKELEDIGLKVQVEIVQKSLLLEYTAKSQALFFRGSWIADYPDAENYLSVFYGKNPAPPNYTRYKNPAFDELYERALLVTSDSVRIKMYQQLDQMVINDAPIIPLWYDEVIRLVNPWIKGFQPNGLNLLELRYVTKGKAPSN
ncbi:MAG: ABC transporter substrate-binding protein [Flavitalea sp.]